MTNIEYLRFLISDRDPMDQLFTDDELEALIKQNTVYRVIEPKKIDNRHFNIGYKMIDEGFDVEVVNESNIPISATIDRATGEVVTDTEQYRIKVKAKVVLWNEAVADIYEAIAADFRKLSSYSTSINQQNYDDTKAILLRMAKSKRTVKGMQI
jgi:hypothetical protein